MLANHFLANTIKVRSSWFLLELNYRTYNELRGCLKSIVED